MDESGEDFDNVCPLCMEEMDSTDRSLRPCQCGYQICVWCWHQVIDQAERDNIEGRCPACRTPYDKDKVVGARPSCAQLELPADKRKSQKTKSKTQEGRKHLSNVRVVQRNLVYIVGFPVNLADEETLERREFFGQYGKILKVAVSRQHSHNGPTASVYVTFVREEDAKQCIRAIDGCIFEGKLLRACYGTNKYCNAWLKNMPCNNPDCLYLHDEGPDEDSYTKEEMIAKCGSKNQFHDLTKPPHRAVGVLPPPVLEASSSVPSVSSQQPSSLNRISLPKPSATTTSGAFAKVTNLPPAAAWGMRGAPAKTASKVPVSAVKKKPSAITNSVAGGSKATMSVKDGDDLEMPSNSYGTMSDTSERVEDCGSPGREDLKGDTQTDSSQGSSSPDHHGFGVDLHHSEISGAAGDSFSSRSGFIFPQENFSDHQVNVGDFGNIDGRASSSETLSPKNREQRKFEDREEVMNALERIDLNREDPEARIASSSNAADTKYSRGDRPAENNIIADILTMDFSGDGALSPGDLTKLYLTGKTAASRQSEEYVDSHMPWKPHGKQQSRFSFARQDESSNFGFDTQQSSEPYPLDGYHSSRETLSRTASAGGEPALKSRLFAPPGFAGTSVPPPGFSLRTASSVPVSPAGNRLNDFDLIDPAIMAVGRGQLQNELSRTLRTQPKPEIRQLLSPNDSDSILGLELQQSGFLEFGNLLKQHQQHQQQQRHEQRKVALKYPIGGDDFSSILHGEVGSLARQYENSYIAGSARNYRSLSSLDNSWNYGTDAFAKFKRGAPGIGNAGMSNSIRPADANNVFFSSANQGIPSLEHYMGEPSFQDIQGAFV